MNSSDRRTPDRNSRKKSRGSSWIWIAPTALLLITVVFLFIKNAKLREELQLTGLQTEIADKERTTIPIPPFRRHEQQELKRLDLQNPESDLTADLITHPELIPHDGVHGGTMHIVPDGIHVLTGRYVLASFEDGHVMGWMLLEYNVAKDGTIDWKVLSSYLQ